MPVRSLVELASQACIKHVRHIDSVGDFLPYENVRHILLKVESAQQLRRIELNSPHIDGRTGEVWLKLIEKDFPMEFRSHAYKPQDPSKWYKVWEKYKRDHDRAVEESERKLKNALMGLQQDREKNTSKIVDRKLLPRKGVTGPKRSQSSSSLNFTGGSRTSTRNGASVMRKVRREVKEIASIHGSLSKTIGAPQRQTEIKKAPQSMINAHRRSAQPSNEPSRRPPPKVSAAVKEHEDRATFISDSEGDDDEELFDNEQPKKRPAPKPAPKPVSTGASRSAAASLLKTRPAVPSASRPIKSPSGARSADQRPKLEGRPQPSASPAKTMSSKPSMRDMSPPSSTSSRAATSSSSRPRANEASSSLSSPPLPSNSTPSAPPPAGSSPARPPKRKAVDIFMRPKKRPN